MSGDTSERALSQTPGTGDGVKMPRTRHTKKTAALTVLLMVLTAATAACGESNGSSSENVVHVTLTDSAQAQSVESDVTTFKAGLSYHFVVENTGALAHELMIVKPIEAGLMDMEEMDAMALHVIEEDDLEAGTTTEFDYTFPADAVGTPLEFACHISGHYELGMHTPITVES